MDATERARNIKELITAIVATIIAVIGWLGVAVLLLIVAMAVDYITGTIAARASEDWSSAMARAGLRHKLGTIVAVGVAAFADAGVQITLHQAEVIPIFADLVWPQAFTLIVTLWYLFTELGSIIENLGKMGVTIPSWMSRGIAVLKSKAGEAAGSDEDAAKLLEQIRAAVAGGQTPQIYGDPVPEPDDDRPRGKHEKADPPAAAALTGDPHKDAETLFGPTPAEVIGDLKDVD